MGRTARDRREHLPKPVQKIELNARHMKMRLALAIFLLLGGVGLIFYSMRGPAVQAGWTEIRADAGDAGCAADFTFLYPLGTTGSPRAEYRALTALYTGACRDAGRIFGNDAAEDVHNIRFLNDHPNEEVQVDPGLYAALEQIAESKDRSLYLAPVYEIYNGVFHCEDVSETAYFDLRQNEELRDWFGQVCAYAMDPAQVDLELLGDNRVRLKVSDEYLAFAQAEEIGSFIDLYWMKNAFIADYLAARLADNGYSIGTLSSADGFLRNLDAAGETDYSLGLYGLEGNEIRSMGVLHYRGAQSFVCLRSYPLTEDAGDYCALPDGRVLTPFLDVQDGLCKSAVSDLTAYAKSAGCGEILLNLIPVYITEEFAPERLEELADEGIQSIGYWDGELHYTEETLDVETESGQ